MLVAAGAFKWVCGSACLVRLLCCSHFWARNKELEGKRRRKDSSRSADDDSFFIHFEFLFVRLRKRASSQAQGHTIGHSC